MFRSKLRAGVATLGCSLTVALPQTVAAQGWEYSVSLYAWMSGIETSVGTPVGTVDAELSFSDVLDNLDFAFFGTFEARNGPWVVLGDLNYSDLSASRDTPIGLAFSSAEVDTTLTIASAFAGYAVVDRPDLRIEAGGGLRFYDLMIDLALQGGGSHGAFTWGVLDRILETDWIGSRGSRAPRQVR
jgi:hypothetical protein